IFGLAQRVRLVLLAAPLPGGTLTGHAQALAAKEPNKLVAHRAIYEMTLDDARSASGTTGIDGRTGFEVPGSGFDGHSLHRASAAREPPNEAVKVKLSQPSHAEIDLAGQVLFPTQHSLALIDAAQTGQALFHARIYDGSGKGRKGDA